MIANRILIVENDLETCNVVEETLHEAGYSVDIAPNSGSAIRKVKSQSYPAAIVAAQLPDADGNELFERIHEHQPSIAGILLTRNRSLDSLKAGIDRGFSDVLTKPINLRRLLTRVEEVAEVADG